MADQTKNATKEDASVCAKAQELLSRFPSTVFAFDTSGDSRYIRCDFPQCKQHAEALQGKHCWLLNTLKNVKVLERHVGKEVHHYMKERDSGTDDQVANAHYIESEGFLDKQWLPEGTRKVLAVFNLKDPQSQFGDWMSLFLKAAFMAEGTQQSDCLVITQNFVSRQELMECIAKLSFLNNHWPTVEVVTVLSCHSSCQGQVFACTPFAIGKQCGFEEFCSLHDFVMACQSVLKDVLMATHISSCFTLKLDCSHADWPVDADWLKTKLHSILCGSTKEVYETGSQVADLHLMLSTMIPSITSGTCGTRLREAVNRACSEGFPDLAREMGLGFLGCDNVDERLLTEGKEDQVTPPGLVLSSMRVVFLVQDEFPGTPSQEPDNSRHCGSYTALADAIVANLQTRKASDVKFEYMVIRVQHRETNLLQESLKNHLDLLPCDSFKVLFVALGPMFSRPNVEFIRLVREWNDHRTGDICYGVHLQHVTAMQAYVIKNRLKLIQGSDASENSLDKTSSGSHLAVTGLVENDNKNCCASFPVLLYMIHLAIGENGNRLAGKGIPSAVYSKKPVGHGMSSWTLEEVYMETCHVLSGLSRKCGLHLLSPALNPVRSTLTTGTSPKAVHTTYNEGNMSESIHEKSKDGGLLGSGIQPAASSEDADPSSNIAFLTKVWATAEDGNSAESSHEDGEIIGVIDNKISVNEDTDCVRCDDKPSSSTIAAMMNASFSEGNGNNGASNSDCNPFISNEEPGGVVFHEKPLSTIGSVMASAKPSAGIGHSGVAVFNNTPIGPSSAVSPAEDVLASLGEDGFTVNEVDTEDGLCDQEGSDCGPCYETPTLGISPSAAISPLGEDSSLPELSGSTAELDDDESELTKMPGQHVTYQEKTSSAISSCSTISSVEEGTSLPQEVGTNVKLVDGEDRLGKELDCLTHQEKPSSTISSDEENTISPQEKGSKIKLVDVEGQLEKEADDAMCHAKPCLAISRVGEGASLSMEDGSALNIVPDVGGPHDEPVFEMYDDNPCSTTSSVVTNTRGMPVVEENTDLSTSVVTKSDGINTPFQTFLQNFTNYCKEQNEIEKKQIKTKKKTSTSQGATGNCRGKKGRRKKRSRKHRMPGNLESYDTSTETQNAKQTGRVPSTNMSEFVCKDTSGGQIGTSDHEEIECESESVNSAEAVPYTYRNVFEIMPDKEAQSKTENAFETWESKDIEIDCEEACARKRSLPIDNSGNVEQISAKKLKNDSGSECKIRTERSLDTNWDTSEDLPLMANVDEVLVHHYILDLSVKFSEKTMKGNIVLFLEPRNEEVTKRQFQMTLDSTLVNIESVSEVVLPEDFEVTFCSHKQDSVLTQGASSSGEQNGFLGNILGDTTHTPLPFKGLSYSVYGWCVQIWKPDATGKAWPRCVWIKYHTSPEGTSLTWATDQDGKPSVFSPGAYINNRSLMPCQEPPVAMSTWQASIHVPEGCVVLMSGNQFVGKTTGSDNQVTYHYEMDCPLPCSTLAVAVGWWECRQSPNAETKNGNNPDVPVTCRLFAPPSLIDRAADELLGYAPKFLEASCELLGPYPFRRLDMLILPKCFACMGLKSPNLVFLSQSLLSGDASMRVRLAHEISHAWFGLLVGAKDWSEEWLSEGFATFIEEKIQSRAERWSKYKDRFYREMRQILRHRCLLSEIKECDDSLKCLRPKVVKPASAISTAKAVTRSSDQSEAIRPHTVVQFGQICSRKWTQVHYLKGYFLLHHMASVVGLDEFDEFLFNYVQHFKGQLVTSEDFFGFFIESFPNVPGEMKDKFVHEWLERAGLPKSFPKKFDSPDNELVSQVESEFQTWKKQDMINKRNKTLNVRKRKKPPSSSLEVAEQVVLLLEKLLERETISHNTLRQLDKCYSLSSGNAEIRHRWCELVVKHNYTPGLQAVQRFLVEDQGMGIYLFGELIISQQPKQRALVDEVLKEIGPEMDRCTYQTVKDMLEGND